MNRTFEQGEVLNLSDRTFIIKKIIGKGASSVTYLAECNGTEHILKECNPLGISMHRNKVGVLTADTELGQAKFQDCLCRFKEGIEKQLLFRLTEDLKNVTSNIQDVYEEYGTLYIDMTYLSGETYDNVSDESLYDLFRRIRAISLVVEHYHKKGYLHLDVKPQNIYAIPETPELVIMFDFDSVVPLNDVENMVTLSYTDAWAAPEQKFSKCKKYRDQICQATDLFAIGEIAFYKIFGRHSYEKERFSFSKYDYNCENELFKNVNPKVFPLLTEFFHKTLACAVTKRYQAVGALLDIVEDIIKMSYPENQHIIGDIFSGIDTFIGREDEIGQMHTLLAQKKVLFLRGIDGIGKSELAKHYAHIFSECYDTMIFAPYMGSFDDFFGKFGIINISNFDPPFEDNTENYLKEKFKKFKELCDERTLLIIDNYESKDYQKDDLIGDYIGAYIKDYIALDDFFDLRCKIILTSQEDFSDYKNAGHLVVGALKDHRNLQALLCQEWGKDLDLLNEAEIDYMDRLIEFVEGHTMRIEMIAKEMKVDRLNPKEMLVRLEKGLYDTGSSAIKIVKDGKRIVATADAINQAIFNTDKLKEGSLNILSNLIFMPPTAVSTGLFKEWNELDNFDLINYLIDKGWIQHNDGDTVCIHPVVREVVHKKNAYDEKSYNRFFKNIYGFESNFNNSSHTYEDFQQFFGLLRGILVQMERYGPKTETMAYHLSTLASTLSLNVNAGLEKACYEKALTILGQFPEKNQLLQGEIQYRLSEVLYRCKAYNEAENSCLKAIKIAENAVVLYVKYNAHLVLIYLNKGMGAEARKVREEIRRICAIHGIEDPLLELEGRLLPQIGQYEDAELRLKQALTHYIDTGKEEKIISTYAELCNLDRIRRRYISAEEYGKAALERAEKLPGMIYNPIRAIAFLSMAALYQDMREISTAEVYLKKVLDMGFEQGEYNLGFMSKAHEGLMKLYQEKRDVVNAEFHRKKKEEIDCLLNPQI